MTERWRPWLTALRSGTRASTWHRPLDGILIGAAGAGIYWLAALIWPTSIAVVLSMCVTSWLGAEIPALRLDIVRAIFTLFLKYNALMALSAASLAFPLPPNVALGLIMIAGLGVSRAIASPLTSQPAGAIVLGVAIGFMPAVLLGVPGLVGLAVAIVIRLVLGEYLERRRNFTQQLTEVCFYLGAMATWSFI